MTPPIRSRHPCISKMLVRASCNSNFFYDFFRFRASQLWNRLTSHIQVSPSIARTILLNFLRNHPILLITFLFWYLLYVVYCIYFIHVYILVLMELIYYFIIFLPFFLPLNFACSLLLLSLPYWLTS